MGTLPKLVGYKWLTGVDFGQPFNSDIAIDV